MGSGLVRWSGGGTRRGRWVRTVMSQSSQRSRSWRDMMRFQSANLVARKVCQRPDVRDHRQAALAIWTLPPGEVWSGAKSSSSAMAYTSRGSGGDGRRASAALTTSRQSEATACSVAAPDAILAAVQSLLADVARAPRTAVEGVPLRHPVRALTAVRR